MLPSHRDLFEIPRNVAYFNNASYTPLPRCVREAGQTGVATKSTPWRMDPAQNPEWTRAMFRKAKPASKTLPGFIGESATTKLMKRKPGRPPSEDKRVVRSFRLPVDVVQAYEATGTDWRQLVERTLRDHMPARK